MYTHNLCFEQKLEEKNRNFSTENCHFSAIQIRWILHRRVIILMRKYMYSAECEQQMLRSGCVHVSVKLVPQDRQYYHAGYLAIENTVGIDEC